MKDIKELTPNECIHCFTREEYEGILSLITHTDTVTIVSLWDRYKTMTVIYPNYWDDEFKLFRVCVSNVPGANGEGSPIYEAATFWTPPEPEPEVEPEPITNALLDFPKERESLLFCANQLLNMAVDDEGNLGDSIAKINNVISILIIQTNNLTKEFKTAKS